MIKSRALSTPGKHSNNKARYIHICSLGWASGFPARWTQNTHVGQWNSVPPLLGRRCWEQGTQLFSMISPLASTPELQTAEAATLNDTHPRAKPWFLYSFLSPPQSVKNEVMFETQQKFRVISGPFKKPSPKGLSLLCSLFTEKSQAQTSDFNFQVLFS